MNFNKLYDIAETSEDSPVDSYSFIDKLGFFPEKTQLIQSDKQPEQQQRKRKPNPVKVHKQIKSTRMHNTAKKTLKQRNLVAYFENEIIKLEKNTSPRRKKRLLHRIQCLRPSKAALRKYYAEKGDSPDTINLLVTNKNYEYLPAVHLTKQQQRHLLNKLSKV